MDGIPSRKKYILRLAEKENDMNKEDAMQIIDRAKSKDPKALEIIFSNPKDEFFLHFIVVRARTDKGEIGERAREFVYKNQNFDKCWNCIVGMASDGSKYAFGIVLKNVDRFGSLKCIAEWASKDPRARKIVFEHFDDRNCWANIVSLAKEGYRDAIEIVLQNIGRDGAEPCIVDVVKKPGFFKDFLNKKNQNAISFARKHPEYLDSMEYFIDCARNGDEDADNLVLQNIRNANYQEKIVNLLIRGDDWAKGKLSQLAELGNRYAIKKILANPEKNEIAKSFAFKHPEYLESMGFIIETARKGDKDADDIVLRNIGNANYQEKIVNLSKEDDEWASRKLPRLAELGNRDAIEYIRAHPEKDGYWYYVVQEAKKGNSECLDMVFNHCAQNKECERFVLEMSEKGDIRASKKVIELAQNGNQVFQEAVYHNFPDNSMFRQIVIDKASSGVKFAEKMVLDTLKKGLSRIQGFDGLSYVLKLAKKIIGRQRKLFFQK